jgi:lipid II:glycine glycyltransferase (peptidoglycan interpeptide bridge formation enzyme)
MVTVCEDKAAWDRAVQDLHGALYLSWGWGEVYRRVGRRPWRVLARDENGNAAAIQIFEIRVAPGVSLFYAPSGMAATNFRSPAARELTNWLRSFLKRKKGPCLRVDPPILDGDSQQKKVLEELGFVNLPDVWPLWGVFVRNAMVVDLRPGETDILAGMRQKHRQHIRRAEKNGLRIELGTTDAYTAALCQLVENVGQRRSFAPRNLSWFKSVQANLLEHEAGTISIAWLGEVPVAGLLCARFDNRCYALYAGFQSEHANLHAVESVYWSTMRWARRLGCVEYDMQSVPVSFPPTDEQAGYGLYHFKAGFGAEFRHLAGAFDLVGSEVRYQMLRRVEKSAGSQIWRLADWMRLLRARWSCGGPTQSPST